MAVENGAAKPHVIGIVQARMRSTRLPGKVLKPLPSSGDKPVLFHVLSRLSHCTQVTRWILATSTLPDDDIIEQFGKEFGVTVFRGDEQDCVKRFYDAAVSQQCAPGSFVVRITSDNPCTDWNYVDASIAEAVAGKYDLFGLWDTAPRSEQFPNGLDCEILSFHALEQVCLKATHEHDRNHVIPYIYDHPQDFHIGVLQPPELVGTADFNWTLDTPEDYKFLDAVYQEIYSADKMFATADVLALLKRKPELLEISPKPAWRQNAGTYKTLLEKLGKDLSQRTVTNFKRSDEYRNAIHELIPGGAHTYSKGDDQYPQLSPACFERGAGGRCWDEDENEFVDTSLALGTVSLGHAFEPVVKAAAAQMARGSSFQRPATTEREAAVRFLDLLKSKQVEPKHNRIKFARNGSTCTTAAVKLARAFTKRDMVAFPSNHPFYSYDDWYIACKPNDAGVPGASQSLFVLFDTTDPSTLREAFEKNPGKIACVICTPDDTVPKDPEVNRELYRIANGNGALMIFDEMVSGFRSALPGTITDQELPCDMATWGKAVGNGFSFCALTGRAEVMDLGGIKQTERERVFLMSTSHGGEAHALAAGIAVMDTFQKHGVIFHCHRLIRSLAVGIHGVIEEMGLQKNISMDIMKWRIVMVPKDHDGKADMSFRTLLLQEMIGRGVMFNGQLLTCFEHTSLDIAHVLEALRGALTVYKKALEAKSVDGLLVGPPCMPVFRKWNHVSGDLIQTH